MFLHLGADTIIDTKTVVGIFDLDKTTVSKRTREYLSHAEKQGAVVNVSHELPKSFVVCAHKKREQKLFVAQLNTATLKKRLDAQRQNKQYI